jgi:hypothetical protein
LSAPMGPILLFHKLIQRRRSRQRDKKRRGRDGAAIAYSILLTVLLILRASAIFSAPVGPILLFCKLIQRERERERERER